MLFTEQLLGDVEVFCSSRVWLSSKSSPVVMGEVNSVLTTTELVFVGTVVTFFVGVVLVVVVAEVVVVAVAVEPVVVMMGDNEVSDSSHSYVGQHSPLSGLIILQVPYGWGGHSLKAHDISPLWHWHSLQGSLSFTLSPCLYNTPCKVQSGSK